MQIKPSRRQEEKAKEVSVRERALEFAKNVPKPRIRNGLSSESNQEDAKTYQEQSQSNSKYLNPDLNGIEEEEYDQYGNTLLGNELLTLNQKHDNYSNEIEKIK